MQKALIDIFVLSIIAEHCYSQLVKHVRDVCCYQVLEEYDLPELPEILSDYSALRVLHTLLLHGEIFPPTFACDHAQAYESVIETLRTAIVSLALSDEAHSVTEFSLLPNYARIAWILVELLIRSGLLVHLFSIGFKFGG